jgi:hypothetical protein
MNRKQYRRLQVIKGWLDGLHNYQLFNRQRRPIGNDGTNISDDDLLTACFISCDYLYGGDYGNIGLIGKANCKYITDNQADWLEEYGYPTITWAQNSVLISLDPRFYHEVGNEIISGLQAYAVIDDCTHSEIQNDEFTENFWDESDITLGKLIRKRLAKQYSEVNKHLEPSLTDVIDSTVLANRARQCNDILIGEFNGENELDKFVKSLNTCEILALFEIDFDLYTQLEQRFDDEILPEYTRQLLSACGGSKLTYNGYSDELGYDDESDAVNHVLRQCFYFLALQTKIDFSDDREYYTEALEIIPRIVESMILDDNLIDTVNAILIIEK